VTVDSLSKVFVLLNEFLYLALIYFISTGILLLPEVFSSKDLILISLLVVIYTMYSMLYIIYGSIMNLLLGVLYLILAIYACRITTFTASKIASVMHDLQQSSNHSELNIPKRKLNTVFLIRKTTIALLVFLIIGSLLATILSSSYFWIAEIYNKSIKLIYLFMLLYIFRCTKFNVMLYDPIPCVQSILQGIEELYLRELTDNTLSSNTFNLDGWYLVSAPGNSFYVRFWIKK
jgi:hypothetical protein